MKKRLVSVLLSTAMVASLIAGCGSSASTGSADAAGDDAAAESTDASAGRSG